MDTAHAWSFPENMQSLCSSNTGLWGPGHWPTPHNTAATHHCPLTLGSCFSTSCQMTWVVVLSHPWDLSGSPKVFQSVSWDQILLVWLSASVKSNCH